MGKEEQTFSFASGRVAKAGFMCRCTAGVEMDRKGD
jgi:hypothetical protein